jgi:hypothetical protein
MTAPRFVGKLRPTQIVTTFGPGAIVDLPTRSVVIAGLEWWSGGTSIYEPRLQSLLGVDELRRPPRPAKGGFVPCLEFPRWQVCGRDGRMLRGQGCPEHGFDAIYPARLIQACPKGHLDEFPWGWWLHRGAQCRGDLRLSAGGRSATLADLVLRCTDCGRERSLAGATSDRLGIRCQGRRPWLRTDDTTCDADPRGMLRGASNVYFPLAISALSIPPWTNPVQEKINPVWNLIADKSELDLRQIHALMFQNFSLDLFLEAVATRRGITAKAALQSLKAEEFRAIASGSAQSDSEFQVASVQEPGNQVGLVGVRRIDRLREVVALKAFTRIDYPDRGSTVAVNEAPLASVAVDWRPAVENRGEGLFLMFDSAALAKWGATDHPSAIARSIEAAFHEWRTARGLGPATPPTPAAIYLHSLSHLLIRQLSLDSGYSSSSLRERLYTEGGSAGILIYTASSDSDGSLGGLVAQSRPSRLGPLLEQALAAATVCSSDPLCSERQPRGGHLSAAACHACLLIPETSCELGNRFLDRGFLVELQGIASRAFPSWGAPIVASG